MTNIIIQGAGFVGQATSLFLRNATSIHIDYNDPIKHEEVIAIEPYYTYYRSEQEWVKADYVIICVPTNLDITKNPPENSMENVRNAINYAIDMGYKGNFVVRSTLSISGVQELENWLGNKFILWPEYIRERHYREDSINPRSIVIGNSSLEGLKFGRLLDKYKDIIHYVYPMEAQLAKLATNSFLSMKVIFANQLYHLAKQLGTDYNSIVEVLQSEGRLGDTHWTVPGPDGKFGFGGTCFPKDTKTFETALKSAGIDDELITAVNNTNNKIREEND